MQYSRLHAVCPYRRSNPRLYGLLQRRRSGPALQQQLAIQAATAVTAAPFITTQRCCATSSIAAADSSASSSSNANHNSSGSSRDNSSAMKTLAGQPLHSIQDQSALSLLQNLVPTKSMEEIKEMIKGARNPRDARVILERAVYPHHLCFDVLNGHGFRVMVLQTLTGVAPRIHCMHEWFDCVDRFRRLGFVLTRTFAAEGFTTIRQWLTNEFRSKGRSPALLTEGTAHVRELMQWSAEDRLVFDHVLYTRIIFLLTMIVSFFDRQNLYRASFAPDFTKRDGVVVEWVVSNERCTDFDECVLQCDGLMEEVLERMRAEIPSRPPFSLMYRLMDYYFATDNVDKMIAVMEDAVSYGVNIAESTTAKLMQLACAFNYPQVPELFLRWRVLLPQCVIATPDMSRLLFYYGRSGGGRPCPRCGEPFNHRNANVYCWMQTPPHQRACPALQMARMQKGELEESRELPQNADWSTKAFQLWEMSKSRSIEWGMVEWRAFLLCSIFSPRAMEAKQLLDDHFDLMAMDDFLRATYIRLLRHHAPEMVLPTLDRWKSHGCGMSPIALQEGLMGSVMVPDESMRIAHVKTVWAELLERDSYVMPLTRRFFERRREQLRSTAASRAEQGEGRISAAEEQLMRDIIQMQPRRLSLLDMKDSASDFVVGTRRKNVYTP